MDKCALAQIRRADILFIASVFSDGTSQHTFVDVSHRGELPGFVSVAYRVLISSKYRGNLFFNTMDNIVSDGRTGPLCIDFETGDLLQLSGRAQIVWKWPLNSESLRGAECPAQFLPEICVMRRSASSTPSRYLEQAPQFASAWSLPIPWTGFNCVSDAFTNSRFAPTSACCAPGFVLW